MGRPYGRPFQHAYVPEAWLHPGRDNQVETIRQIQQSCLENDDDMRDRLRAVSCPSEMIDRIGGGSSGKFGEGNGEGCALHHLHESITKLS